MARVNMDAVEELVDQGYLTARTHPENQDLFIINYTPKCQFERKWNELTMTCRGLIVHGDGTIAARGFKKFFNVEEYGHGDLDPLPWDYMFEVSEKLDGSLGILYWYYGKPYIATRGSFQSEQALAATKILHEKYYYAGMPLNPDYTYLFEYIAPDNRIVVDYGDREDIVLLAILNTETGRDVPIFSHWTNPPFPVRKQYMFRDVEQIQQYMEQHNLDGEEGFVICFADGTRAKWKFESYIRLHKILTGVNERDIWEMLRDGTPIEKLLDRVPDEFYKWVMRAVGNMQFNFRMTELWCRDDLLRLHGLENRKAIAERVKDMRLPQIVFRLLDDKEYSDAIWKLFRPAATRPFALGGIA